jgi:hypothetical protein
LTLRVRVWVGRSLACVASVRFARSLCSSHNESSADRTCDALERSVTRRVTYCDTVCRLRHVGALPTRDGFGGEE